VLVCVVRGEFIFNNVAAKTFVLCGFFNAWDARKDYKSANVPV